MVAVAVCTTCDSTGQGNDSFCRLQEAVGSPAGSDANGPILVDVLTFMNATLDPGCAYASAGCARRSDIISRRLEARTSSRWCTVAYTQWHKHASVKAKTAVAYSLHKPSLKPCALT